jgi:hypothetical protein
MHEETDPVVTTPITEYENVIEEEEDSKIM